MRGDFSGLQALEAALAEGNKRLDDAQVEQEIAYAIAGGGSGRGMSYYSQAARCGRKARLQEERRLDAFEQGRIALNGEKHALAIGSIYHLMQQQARQNLDNPIDFKQALGNVNVAEAYRMFAGWKAIFGLDFWGRCIGVEQKCSFFVEDMELTGAFDMVVDMDAATAARVASRFEDGMRPGPGRYIIDWKTADSGSNGVAYRYGLQALWYPALYELVCKHRIDGIIFDVAMKRGRRADRGMHVTDFAAHLVLTPPLSAEYALKQITPMARQGMLNVLQDRPNRGECVDWQGKMCNFFNNGCEQ